MPTVIVQLLSQIVSFVSYNLNLPIPFLSVRKQHFGSVLLTNVSGMQGFHEVTPIKQVFAPITNFTRSIASVVLCTPKERAVVEDGQIKVAKMMNFMITFDHRYLDGAGATKMFDPIFDVWNNPAKYF